MSYPIQEIVVLALVLISLRTIGKKLGVIKGPRGGNVILGARLQKALKK
ncbi:MAG: hypothetical protein HY791_31215 [Deltaproteobacteria bacterium]|nr:hypothetical protein [Deltaproteobacteria bacterium]